MYIEHTDFDQHRNMTKHNATTRRATKQQDSLAVPPRPRARSESLSHKRSASVGANIKKTNSAKPNNNNNKKSSPLTPESLLCYTVVHRDEILLQKLLTTYPTEVNKLSDEGCSPLHLAAMDGNIKIMNILLQNGAKLENCDYKNRSALEYAVLSGQFDAAQFLIENGCDSTLIRDGYTGMF